MEKIILIGCGGHAKSVVDSIEKSGQYKIVGFLDKEEHQKEKYKHYTVIGNDELLQEIYESGIINAFISIGYLGNSNIRNTIFKKLKEIGFFIPNIIDSTAILANDVVLGEGNYIGKGAIVNSNATIGNACIINTKALVEHDCKIGNFVHIAVGATLCGGVVIKENTFVGANSVIIQEKTIGSKTIIGAGSIVTQNIKSNIKYIQKIYG